MVSFVANCKRICKAGIQLVLSCILVGLLLPPLLFAQDLDGLDRHGNISLRRETITGNWGGLRTELLDRGIYFRGGYMGELFHMDRRHRNSQTRYFGYLDFELHANLQQLLDGPDGHFFFYATLLHGNRFQPFIGSVHDLSNIEGRSNLLLMQAWYDQHFFQRRMAILVGIYDIANEFDYRESAQVFLNGAFGTGVDLTESGIAGVPTYPLTTLGMRLRINPTPNWYYRGAVLDGVPGDPQNPRGTRVVLDADDEGVLFMNEVGYESARPRLGLNKAGIGSWWYTKRFPDLVETNASGNPATHTGTQGLYLFAEGTFYLEYPRSKQGLRGFARLGFSDQDVNALSTYFDAGLEYTGLFPGRDKDKAGIGISYLFFGDKYKQRQRAADIVIDDPEVLVEATYKIRVQPGVFLQPDVQYVFNPVARAGAVNTLSVGFRFGLNF
ncbi:carbohydrate porin [Nitrospina gracilis]|uniref:carbohydrate porin n=1 Tax=Nitrospina gracilis TaxID=35801 RepID=UPI001F210119|nr:carbohydrate porin [Nitrospina gracilis]MCF8720957.1 porin [Nitrospina gracilis Nb-211]